MEKMYEELADWWRLISPLEDYEEEAAIVGDWFAAEGIDKNAKLLELGAGGGSLAFFLKQRVGDVVLTDLAPNMLAQSQEINPDCRHVLGDMRDLDLKCTFDAVLVHDAIDYMKSEDDLRRAIATVARHCRVGSVAVLLPDAVCETFEEESEQGGSESGGRSLKFLEWTYDPDPADTVCITDYVYLLREPGKTARVVHDQHECGLFPEAVFTALLAEAGFSVRTEDDEFGRRGFIATYAP